MSDQEPIQEQSAERGTVPFCSPTIAADPEGALPAAKGDGPRQFTSDPAADGVAPASRPRRAIEQDYIAALADAVSLDDWRDIVRAAVARAKAGDVRARQWLAEHLTGDHSLLRLAADEYNGDTFELEIERAAADQQHQNEREDRKRSLDIRRRANLARGRP